MKEMVTGEENWEERNGHWQIVLQFINEADKLGSKGKPVARRKAIRVDPAIYLAYVGRYKFSPNRILTISHEEGRLIHQGSGGHRAELFPETTARLFRKDAPVLTTFVKDRDGHVTHVLHRHTDGRESIGKCMA